MNLLLDPFKMIRDIRALGGFIGIWGGLLNIPQVIGGLLFIRTPEGLVILLTVMVVLIAAGQIHKHMKFSRLIGLCHIPWLLMLPWLVIRMVSYEHSMALTIWLAFVVVTVGISLVFDVFDIFRFSKGDKTFAWAK
ncbi:hypothetical protein [Octadecabacter ascidiaceicola]|uniref:Uncharacterized protein n=1 Tax=Octadecabacter ascidiaceicola TaxID=1655543 RepID=A0A238K3B5_9RHOB|nr:hypothetical protein [Octadecabacter ascidiaceicola]SMX36884.1 hypothetical protein OCA8868_01151 [Octadecabacter ascidiaceicola]